MTDKLKKIFSCTPLSCFSVILVIIGLLFNSLKGDLAEFRKEIRADLAQVNSLLLTHIQTASRNSAKFENMLPVTGPGMAEPGQG